MRDIRRLAIYAGLAAMVTECFGSDGTTRIAIDAGVVYEKLARDIFGEALRDLGHNALDSNQRMEVARLLFPIRGDFDLDPGYCVASSSLFAIMCAKRIIGMNIVNGRTASILRRRA